MRYQSFLIKYAEIGIKGKNRHIFEEALVRQIKHALKPCEGNFAVHRTYGRVFVECLSDYEYSEVTEALSRVFGISGIACCLMPSSDNLKTKINPMLIVVAGIAAYIVLLLVTRLLLHRPVTTELFLIVGWCMLEMTVINRLNALGSLEGSRFVVMCAVTAAAVIASLVLYVLYYRMEEMRAFYAAMVPLVTEAAAMGILVILYCIGKSGAA